MKAIVQAALAAILFISCASAQSGVVIVNNDEWTLSNTGFTNASGSTDQFALNVASLLTGGSGSIHAYSNFFAFKGSSLDTTLTNAGYTYTTGDSFAFTPANIAGYDALFMGGTFLSASEITTLINYVNAGGGVYLVGGTNPSATATAAAWNPFLNVFGMSHIHYSMAFPRFTKITVIP